MIVTVFDPIENFNISGNGMNCPLQEELPNILPYIVLSEYYDSNRELHIVMKDCMEVSNFFYGLFVDSTLVNIYVQSVMSACRFDGSTFERVDYYNEHDEESEVRYVFKCYNEPRFSLVNIGEAMNVPEYF